VVTRNDIHSDTKLAELFQEHDTVGFEGLEVYELAVLIIVT
jgi:hypothetical protein